MVQKQTFAVHMTEPFFSWLLKKKSADITTYYVIIVTCVLFLFGFFDHFLSISGLIGCVSVHQVGLVIFEIWNHEITLLQIFFFCLELANLSIHSCWAVISRLSTLIKSEIVFLWWSKSLQNLDFVIYIMMKLQHLKVFFTCSGSFLFLPPPLWGCVRCGFKAKLLSDLRFPPAAQASHFHPVIYAGNRSFLHYKATKLFFIF